MVRYRNVRHGGIIERPAKDEWLEASAGWERVEDDKPQPKAGKDNIIERND